MPRLEVTIKTRDGNCPASVFTPANKAGPWPAVIFFMDGFGIRPAMWEMGQRLADGGYVVLLNADLRGGYFIAISDQTWWAWGFAEHGGCGALAAFVMVRQVAGCARNRRTIRHSDRRR